MDISLVAKMKKYDEFISYDYNEGDEKKYIKVNHYSTEPFIVRVLEEGLDVIGMLKDFKQCYYYNG